MEIRVLKYFLAACREQSISGAAQYLYISQPTLSRQLHELEEELGTQLFIRGNRHITLTEDGILLRKRAEEIIDLVDKTTEEIQCSDENITGEIKIGAGETDCIRFIANAAKKMIADYPNVNYPNVKFDIISGDGEDIADKLNKGLIDFGIIFEPYNTSKFEYIKIPREDQWGVLMRKNFELANYKTIAPKDLWDKPLLISRQQKMESRLMNWFGKNIEELNIISSFNLIYNASIMVDEGLGYAVCLDKLVNVIGDTNLCFRPLEPELHASLNFVWKKYQIFSRAAEKFLNYVTNII